MTVVELPIPKIRRVEDTGHPRWVALRVAGVQHRAIYVFANGRRETACGRRGWPRDSTSTTLCTQCAARGWHPDFEEPT